MGKARHDCECMCCDVSCSVPGDALPFVLRAGCRSPGVNVCWAERRDNGPQMVVSGYLQVLGCSALLSLVLVSMERDGEVHAAAAAMLGSVRVHRAPPFTPRIGHAPQGTSQEKGREAH
jgi:hypothetical protein